MRSLWVPRGFCLTRLKSSLFHYRREGKNKQPDRDKGLLAFLSPPHPPSSITIDTSLVGKLRGTYYLHSDKIDEAFRAGVHEKPWTFFPFFYFFKARTTCVNDLIKR